MTEHEKAVAAIHRQLDQGPWRELLVLADLALDVGDDALSEGYRWMVRWGRWPVFNFHCDSWNWSYPGIWQSNPGALPSVAFPKKKYKFNSLSHTLSFAAAHLGTWLSTPNGQPYANPPDRYRHLWHMDHFDSLQNIMNNSP